MLPVVHPQLLALKDCAAFNCHLSCLGNPYSSQPTSGLLKCPTPPPAKSQSLNRKHSMELSQSGLLSPASLSPMGSSQSECPDSFHLSKVVSWSCAATSDMSFSQIQSFPDVEFSEQVIKNASQLRARFKKTEREKNEKKLHGNVLRVEATNYGHEYRHMFEKSPNFLLNQRFTTSIY